MSTNRYLSALASMAAVVFLAAAGQGCGGDGNTCETGGCECQLAGCGTTSTSTETETATETETGTETGTETETETETATETETGTSTETSTETATETGPASFEEACQKACDCDPISCNDGGASCVQFFTDELAESQQKGCVAQFDAAYSCYDQNLTCVNGQVDFGSCEPLIDELNTCLDGPPPDPTLCDLLSQGISMKLESCGIEVEDPGEPVPDCTPAMQQQIECIHDCILPAPCAVFIGNASDQEIMEYSECISGC